MVKLVVLKLHGSFEQGFQATMEIGEEGDRPWAEIQGRLPPKPNLPAFLKRWQQKYRNVGAPSSRIHRRTSRQTERFIFLSENSPQNYRNAGFAFRIKAKKIIYNKDDLAKRRLEISAQILSRCLTAWLNSEEFGAIDKRLREELHPKEDIRFLIRTENEHLRKFPWHEWDFFKRYQKAEIGLSAAKFERPTKLTPDPRQTKVRILAILGHSAGIDVEQDKQLLESLPNAEIVFLKEPRRQEINDRLWEQQWDILFFAGHSETEGETGRIYINPKESLTIDELWYGLNQAIKNGLQVAIFNSCDGLGLAKQLADLDLYIPQMIVMRELVPDRVAQEFLKYFLNAFAGGKPFYLAVREARQRLQGLESEFPCATWLPIICQNPAEIPPTWEELLGYPVSTPTPFPSQQRRENSRKFSLLNLKSVLLASIICTATVMGVRYLGLLQPWELQSYDRFMQMRPTESADTRLLLVGADEDDSAQYGGYPLPDRTIAQLIKKLDQYQPAVIGLEMIRDRPQPPGYEELVAELKKNPRLIAICQLKSGEKKGIAPPPGLPDERVGFDNVLKDLGDYTVRRYFMSRHPNAIAKDEPCRSRHSSSFQIAYKYFHEKGIAVPTKPAYNWQFGETTFKRLESSAGGYQQLKAATIQTLINYRSSKTPQEIARTVTVREILTDRVEPDWIKDKIILISTLDNTWQNQEFDTPVGRMRALFLHAHIISQILSAVLDKRPLIGWLPQWGDALLVGMWGLTGGVIVGFWRSHSKHLWLAIAISITILHAIYFAFFIMWSMWLPLIPSALALIGTPVVAIALANRQTRQSQ